MVALVNILFTFMHSHNDVHNIENVTDVVKNLYKFIIIVVKSPSIISIIVVVFIIIVLDHHPSTGEHVVELPEDRSADNHGEVVQHGQRDHTQPLEI